MNPDISMITAPDIAKLIAGICKKILAIIATSMTIMPVARNPPRKLKFLPVVKA